MEKSLPHIGSVNFDTLDRLVGKIIQELEVADPIKAINMIMNGEVQMTAIDKRSERKVNTSFWLNSDDATVKPWINSHVYFQLISDGTPAKWYKRYTYFQLTSDGTPAKGWFNRLYERRVHIWESFENILRFEPTKAEYEIVIKKYRHEMTVENILAEAESEGLIQPSVELACMIRERISDQDLLDLGIDQLTLIHGEKWGHQKGWMRYSGMFKQDSSGDSIISSSDCHISEVCHPNRGFVFIVAVK